METKFSRLNKTLAGAMEKHKTERDRVTNLYTRASDFVGKSQDLLNSINNAEYELTLIKPQNIRKAPLISILPSERGALS